MPKESAGNRFGRTVVVETYHRLVKENPRLLDQTVGGIAHIALSVALREDAPQERVVPGAALMVALTEINRQTVSG